MTPPQEKCDVCASHIADDDSTVFAQDLSSNVHVTELLHNHPISIYHCCDACYLKFTDTYDIHTHLLTLKLQTIQAEIKAGIK
jgi:hypothetical protein